MVKSIPTRIEKHGHERIDNYYWLRERDNPEVLAYLETENERAEKQMALAQPSEEQLFDEIKARFKQTDMSVPYRRDGYYYYTRFEEGREYPIFARKPFSLEQPEEIMLDANHLASGHEFFAIGGWAVSASRNLLAYTVDTQGRRVYTTYFKNIATGERLADVIPEVSDNLTWANDDRTLFCRQGQRTPESSCLRAVARARSSSPGLC
jgi:oligopeptidase B